VVAKRNDENFEKNIPKKEKYWERFLKFLKITKFLIILFIKFIILTGKKQKHMGRPCKKLQNFL